MINDGGKYVRADAADIGTDTPKKFFPEDADFTMFLIKQVFTDKDGSTGTLYPVSSDTGMTYDRITATWRRRWNVECYHKALIPIRYQRIKIASAVINDKTQKNFF